MTDHNENIVTFRQAPDEFCADRHNARWGAYRHALYRGVWLDQYRDDEGNSTLLVPEATVRTGRDKRGPGDRSNLISLIPTGNFWVPEAVSRGRCDDQVSDEAYEAMAELPPEDYDPGWRQAIMEPLGVARVDLDRWQEHHLGAVMARSSRSSDDNVPPGKSGREPKVDWNEFWGLAIMLVHEEGLPDTFPKFVQRLEDLCDEEFDDPPARKTIENKTRKVYRKLRAKLTP